MTEAYNLLFTVVLAVLGVLLFLCLLRAILGPRIADRVVGINMLSLKLLVLVLLFWMASPVASHLIGRLELVTNEELDREVSVWKR